MNVISDQQVDFMYNDLNRRGLTIQELADELVDHIYCTIEDEVCRGTSFEVAYNNLVNNLDSNIFQNIQHQTLLSIDFKFQSMKKSMFVFGAFGTVALLAGVIMKNWHLPGAGIVLFLGTLCVVFGFLPLFFYTSYKEQPENRNILLSVIGYFTATFLILGSLFKIMHWPNAGFVMTSGQILLIVAFLPLYLVNVFKKAGETRTNILYIIVIVVIGIASIFMASNVRMSREEIDRLSAINKEYQAGANLVKASRDSAYTLVFQKSNTIQKIPLESYHNKALALDKLIGNLKLDIMKLIDPTATEIKFRAHDNEKVFSEVMHENNNGVVLNSAIQDFENELLQAIKNETVKQNIKALLEFEYFEFMVSRQRYEGTPMIEGIGILSKMQKNIALAEYEVLKTIE